jgi:NTE family protein
MVNFGIGMISLIKQLLKFVQRKIWVLNTLLDFSPERIQLLQNRGYQDAKRILEPILQTLMIERSRQESFARLQETSKRLRDDPPIY